MNKKVLAGLITCIVTVKTAIAQHELPVIIPPSPEAAAFARYGEIPVDHSTGVINISVPIYTIKTGKIQFPISLSYHGSGIKVRDIASIAGLGWVLNSNGMISRTVLGTADESTTSHGTGPYRTQSQFDSLLNSVTFNSPNAPTVAGILDEYNSEYYDKQVDRYSYNFCGHAGVFRFDYLNNAINGVSYKPIQINRLGSGGSTHFKVVDESGFIYLFDSTEYSSNMNGGGVSAWVLNKIISPDSIDELRFHYSPGDNYNSISASHNILSGDSYSIAPSGNPNLPPSISPTPTYEFGFSESIIVTTHTSKRLDSITGIDAVVQFQYLTDRTDGRTNRINKILVLDKVSRATLQQVVFYQSYFGVSSPNTLRMRLDSILIAGSNINAGGQVFSFKYDNTIDIPPGPSTYYAPSHLYSEDYWGYFKGTQAAGYSQIPSEFMTFVPSGHSIYVSTYGGNLNPDSTTVQTCILKEIIYPTGGKTIFEFESNKTTNNFYGYTNSNNGIIGGLRIKSVKSLANAVTTDTVTKIYKYSTYGATSLINSNLYYYQQNYTYIVKDVGWIQTGETMKYVAMSSPRYPLTLSNASPILYYEVTEYFGKDTATANGKIVYEYSPPSYFNYVYQPIESPRFINVFAFDRGNYEPRLMGKKRYKNTNGTYQLIASLTNTYEDFRKYEFTTGLLIDRTRTYVALYDPIDYLYASDYVHEFVYSNTKAYTDVPLLTRSNETIYGGNNDFDSSVTIYQYDTVSLLPIVAKTTNSKGDTLKMTYKYPFDYPGQSPYTVMVQKNILTPVVEQASYNNNNFLKSTKTNYYNWGNNLIAPQTVESKTLTNNTETRIRFHGYDNRGNTLSVSKENDIKMSYVWDYKSVSPIAEVSNADTASIAYTSFEADGKGRWTFSGATTADATAPTGGRCYLASGGNITKTGLASTAYIVSYWGKNGSVNVNSAGPTRTGRSYGSWTYYEHEITTTSITVSGSNYIDELRLYPKVAQMTTYTYAPLIGMTAKCDINNRIVYYEYDNFGRLKLLKDQDGKIVKRIDYQYKASNQQ